MALQSFTPTDAAKPKLGKNVPCSSDTLILISGSVKTSSYGDIEWFRMHAFVKPRAPALSVSVAKLSRKFYMKLCSKSFEIPCH